MKRLLFSFPLLTWLLTPPGTAQIPAEPQVRPNILLILVDDLGVDNLNRYGLGVPGDYPITRTIDGLADMGVTFRNVYANPLCSPTRATILTGRYGFRNTVGTLVNPAGNEWPSLPLCEKTIPEVLDMASSGYGHAAIGKWHLTNKLETTAQHPGQHPEWFGPTDSGFARFAGTMGNLKDPPEDYFNWTRVSHVRGGPDPEPRLVFGPSDGAYATTVCVNDALSFIAGQQEPWFVYLPLQAVHTPIQVPPAHLRTDTTYPTRHKPANATEVRPIFKSMVEATDREIGRLLGSLDLEQTTVIVVGDNGSYVTPTATSGTPLSGAKRSFLEGGLRVPLIVAGAGVTSTPGSEVNALVNTTDLFATVIELATGQEPGVYLPGTTLDSISLVPYLRGSAPQAPRSFAFSELYHYDSQLTPCPVPPVVSPKDHRDAYAIREARYKYVYYKAQGNLLESESLYDLIADESEATDLLHTTPPPTPAILQVRNRLAALVATMKATPGLCQGCP